MPAHLVGEPNERTLDRHPRGVRRRFLQRHSEFFVRAVHFDPPDQRGAVIEAKARQRAFVSLDRLGADHRFERRGLRGRMLRIQCGDAGAARRTPDVVEDAVHDRLAQVGLERAFVLDVDAIEPLEGLQHRVLHQVVGFGEIARPAWQPAAGPAPQPRQVAGGQHIERLAVARTGTREQFEGAFIRHRPPV